MVEASNTSIKIKRGKKTQSVRLKKNGQKGKEQHEGKLLQLHHVATDGAKETESQISHVKNR